MTGRPELALTAEQQTLVLDLAREAAHGVARPAAPLTTFLAGYALGAEGGLDRLAALVSELSAAARARAEGGADDGGKPGG
ncbi:MAG TPA: DUF6457 domain-containing protein [Actinospica sp.]|nr:DUF6457 domain-containing protein [Actinospica sp.]